MKSVVFITFWQGFLISLLMMQKPTAHSQALQTWLLCMEMLPAAVVMWFAFPVSPYLHAARSREQGGIMLAVQNVGNAVTISDVVTDLRHQVLSTTHFVTSFLRNARNTLSYMNSIGTV